MDPLVFARLNHEAPFHDAGHGYDVFGLHPPTLAAAVSAAAPLYDRYFRVDSQGIEQVPETGPAILVANHGGVLPVDAAMLCLDVLRRTDTVVHMAQHRATQDRGRNIHAQNVTATRELIRRCADHPTIRRFVYRSFAEVYALDLNLRRFHFGGVMDGTRARHLLGYVPGRPARWSRAWWRLLVERLANLRSERT